MVNNTIAFRLNFGDLVQLWNSKKVPTQPRLLPDSLTSDGDIIGNGPSHHQASYSLISTHTEFCMNLKLEQEMTAIKYLGMFGVNQSWIQLLWHQASTTPTYQCQPVNWIENNPDLIGKWSSKFIIFQNYICFRQFSENIYYYSQPSSKSIFPSERYH